MEQQNEDNTRRFQSYRLGGWRRDTPLSGVQSRYSHKLATCDRAATTIAHEAIKVQWPFMPTSFGWNNRPLHAYL